MYVYLFEIYLCLSQNRIDTSEKGLSLLYLGILFDNICIIGSFAI
jgi:hypothetical protein